MAEISDNVEIDSINVEKYVKELTNTMIDMTKAMWRMFEQEHPIVGAVLEQRML